MTIGSSRDFYHDSGLFNLFAALKIVGEPAPTELLRMLQDARFS